MRSILACEAVAKINARLLERYLSVAFRTLELGRLSFSEVAEVAATNPVLLIPMGTMEQHGPHMPVNADNMVAEFVATKASEQTGAFVAPGLNYGCSDVFRNFAGTVSIQHDTLARLLEEVCEGYIKHGFRRIVFVNNHGGNEIVIERVARILRKRHGMLVGSVYPWSLGYALMRDQYEDVDKAYGHGAEPETSAMLAMFPEDVTLDRLETGNFQKFQGWDASSYAKVRIPGQSVPGTVYFESDDIAPNGVTGDGSNGTKEIGEVWIERVVGFAVAFVKEFDERTKNEAWAKSDQ